MSYDNLKHRLDNIVSYLLNDAELTDVKVYARTDKIGFPYKGFILTPPGIFRFGAGRPMPISKKDFKRILQSGGFFKMPFGDLINCWQRHGLWEHRVIEHQLVEKWGHAGPKGVGRNVGPIDHDTQPPNIISIKLVLERRGCPPKLMFDDVC